MGSVWRPPRLAWATPHWVQKFTAAGIRAPQPVQWRSPRWAPQAEQKLPDPGVPQAGQGGVAVSDTASPVATGRRWADSCGAIYRVSRWRPPPRLATVGYHPERTR